MGGDVARLVREVAGSIVFEADVEGCVVVRLGLDFSKRLFCFNLRGAPHFGAFLTNKDFSTLNCITGVG